MAHRRKLLERADSPTSNNDPRKRAKSETSPEPTDDIISPRTQGATAFPLPANWTSLRSDSPEFITRLNTFVESVREDLRRQGKRFDGFPKLLDEGKTIVFSWVLDPSIASETAAHDADSTSHGSNETVGHSPRNPIIIHEGDDEGQHNSESSADRFATYKLRASVSASPGSPHEPLSGDVLAPDNRAGSQESIPPPRPYSPSEAWGYASGSRTHIRAEDEHDQNTLNVQPDDRDDESIHSLPDPHQPRSRSSTPSVEYIEISDEETDSGDWEEVAQEGRTLPSGRPEGHRETSRSLTDDAGQNRSRGNRGSQYKPGPVSRNDVVLKRIVIPRGKAARARRVLVPDHLDLPLISVDSRGDCQFLRQSDRCRIGEYSLPYDKPDNAVRLVQDACLVGNNVAIGFAFTADDHSPSQLSVLPLLQPNMRPQRVDVLERGHHIVRESSVSVAGRNKGISALAPLTHNDSNFRVISGGYDGCLYLWTINNEDFSADVRKLEPKHRSGILAVAYSRESRTLLSSASRASLMACSLEAPYNSKETRMSCQVNHIHIHPQHRNLIVLETDHLDEQMHIYDSRNGNFKRKPDMQFGHRNISIEDNRTESRYVRGAPYMTYFARGSRDGVVKVWDFRSRTKPVVQLEHQIGEGVLHTAFARDAVVAYSKEAVTYLDMNA